MEPILTAATAVLAITALVNWIARSINLPSPIVLVVAGAILALAPGLPRIALPPDLVLLVFLPPLIQVERDHVNGSLRSGRINDEIRRRIERELDLREEAIRRSIESAGNTPAARA